MTELQRVSRMIDSAAEIFGVARRDVTEGRSVLATQARTAVIMTAEQAGISRTSLERKLTCETRFGTEHRKHHMFRRGNPLYTRRCRELERADTRNVQRFYRDPTVRTFIPRSAVTLTL